MMRIFFAVFLASSSWAQMSGDLLPPGWDATRGANRVMAGLVKVSAPQVKGAHDAEFVCVGERAYVVAEANDTKAGESAGWPFIYATMSIVNLQTLAVEKVIDFAKSEQAFENETLPVGACFVPRIIQKNASTLRCYFTSEQPGKRQSQMWYRDFDLKSGEFAPTIHKAKLQTTAGTFDFQPQYFHADAAAQGFAKPAVDSRVATKTRREFCFTVSVFKAAASHASATGKRDVSNAFQISLPLRKTAGILIARFVADEILNSRFSHVLTVDSASWFCRRRRP